MTEVYAIKTLPEQDFLPFLEPLSNFLPPDRRALVLSFKKPADLQRSLLGESLTRYLLALRTGSTPVNIRLHRTDKGKPRLDGFSGLHFNITHSGEWISVAVSDREVGIDIEKQRAPQYRIAERYFSPKEVAVLNKLEGPEKASYFFDLWTLKESYLKLLGKGLTRSLGSFSVVKADGVFRLEEQEELRRDIHFFQPELDPGYKLAVCSLSEDFSGTIQHYHVNQLLEELGNLIKK